MSLRRGISKILRPASKSGAESETLHAGGNARFDERRSEGPGKHSETVYAGGNPSFDERRPESGGKTGLES
ncbi:MAG: hypothetical protein H7Z41_11065 [Cytophagales bacterium]|nr:hypothetical protein [Armatimonadota bacterium]